MADKKEKLSDMIEFSPDIGGGSKDGPSVVIKRKGESDSEWEQKIDHAYKLGSLKRVQYTRANGEQVYSEGPAAPDSLDTDAMKAITRGEKPLSQEERDTHRKSLFETGRIPYPARPSTDRIERENRIEEQVKKGDMSGVRDIADIESEIQARADKRDAEGRAFAESLIPIQQAQEAARQREAAGPLSGYPGESILPSDFQQISTQPPPANEVPTTFQSPVVDPLTAHPQLPAPPKPPAPPTPEELAMKAIGSVGGDVKLSAPGADLTPLKKAHEDLKNFTAGAQKATEDSLAKHNLLSEEMRKQALQSQQDALADEKRAIDIQLDTKAQVQKAVDQREALMGEVQRAAAKEVDPSRFWNNKDIGQKAMAAIAGALFGFTGQGMQWLQRLDALIAQDVQMQQADRESNVRGLTQKSDFLKEKAASLRQIGMDESQIHRNLADARRMAAKGYIDQIAMSATDQNLRMTATKMSQDLLQAVGQGAAEIVQRAQANAATRAHVMIEEAKMNQDRRRWEAEMKLKMLAGDKEKEKKLVSPAQVAEMNSMVASVDKVKRAEELIKDGGNFIMRTLKEKLPDGWSTDATLYQDAASRVMNAIARMNQAGALQAGEFKFYMGQVPKYGDYRAAERLADLREQLADQYNTYVKGYGSAGYKTDNLQTLTTGDTLGIRPRE